MISDDINIAELLSKELSNFQLKELFAYLLETGQLKLQASTSGEGFELDGKKYCIEVLREDIPAPTFLESTSPLDNNDDIPPFLPPLITL